MTNKKISILLLPIIILLYITIHLIYLDKYPLIWCDDVLSNAEMVRSFLTKGNFGSDLVAHKSLSHLEKTNVISGRIFVLSNAFFIYTFGLGPLQIRLFSLISGLVAIFLLYLITNQLFNKTVAICSVVFLAFSQFFIVRLHMGRPDITVTTFILLMIYIFLIALEKKSLLLFFISGITSSLTIDVHPPGGVLAVPMFFCLLIFYRKNINKKILFFAVTGILSGIIWWILWHILPDIKTSLFQYFEYYQKGQRIPITGLTFFNTLPREFHRWYTFFWEAGYHRNMFLLVVFIISIIYSFGSTKRNRNITLVFYLLLTGVFCFIFFVPNKTGFYLIYIFPFLAILTANTIYQMIIFGSHLTRYVGITLLLGTSLLFSLENLYIIVKYHDANFNSFIMKLRKHIPKNSPILGPTNYWLGFIESQPYFVDYWGYYANLDGSNRLDYSELSRFIRKKNIQYIIADEGLFWGEKTIYSFIEENCKLIAELEDKFYGQKDFHIHKGKLITKIYKVMK